MVCDDHSQGVLTMCAFTPIRRICLASPFTLTCFDFFTPEKSGCRVVASTTGQNILLATCTLAYVMLCTGMCTEVHVANVAE